MAQPPPLVLAMVLADNVHRDDETTKAYILGTRFTIFADSLPWTHPRLGVYIVLTEGRSDLLLVVRLIDANDEHDAIAQELVEVAMDNPLDEVELTVFLTDVTFTDPGEYRVQLIAEGELLRERRIVVILRELP